MRVSEKRILDAVAAVERHDANGIYLNNAHTIVRRNSVYPNCIDVLFWGQLIASITERCIGVSSCGHHTATTKARINLLLRKYAHTSIYQKDFVWYYSNGCEQIPFFDGVTFNRISMTQGALP
jgi:hypothetical protein